MIKDVFNKTIVVTGGAVGIGYAIAESFLQNNPRVVIILDINEELGAAAINNLAAKYGENKVVFFKCDVITDLESISNRIVEEYKTVDVLVNNAGMLNDSAFKETIEINVTALIDWSFKFWEHMRKDKSGKGGTIMNIASIYGYMIDPYVPVYHASKFAVMGFTKSLGHVNNFTKFGVRVVAICPGFTETVLLKDMKTWTPKVKEEFNAYAKSQPWQKPEAVGKAAVEVFENAKSGTAWRIFDSQPVIEV
ncbi:PREDICTED: 15-hydroxyprostaglandin dehydrogenase [NAD(+)]-like [Papilio polytes]|uniref:15-hydroxyprostaglandin dehydrogenase [NAD(+)]-like n=1 Tax=Papilio polytes TaxID=76194 RepID=UPI00067669BC|nr:PREDICTED: 15-hydroxyprostaglandin dehydrogenase [NAD(+)]-like [Papilio polytes]